jgi:hypothetical protein
MLLRASRSNPLSTKSQCHCERSEATPSTPNPSVIANAVKQSRQHQTPSVIASEAKQSRHDANDCFVTAFLAMTAMYGGNVG